MNLEPPQFICPWCGVAGDYYAELKHHGLTLKEKMLNTHIFARCDNCDHSATFYLPPRSDDQ